MQLVPIGVVRSALRTRAEAPRQGSEGAPDALVVLEPSYRDALQVHPRDDTSRPLTGVFATRSSDRPNPLGLHRVTVRHVDGLELEVGPLEAIDGTPVVDIKPVLRSEAPD